MRPDEPGLETQDFFDVGGSSLDAVRISARIAELLEVEVSPVAVIEAASLAALVDMVDRTAAPTLPPIAHGPADGRFPLSFQQESLLAVIDRHRGRHRLQLPFALDLGPSADVYRAAEAVHVLIARHGGLRTTLVDRAGLVTQSVAPAPDPTAVEVAESMEAGELEAFALADMQPINAPLFFARVARVRGRVRVYFAAHHLVFDGWSRDLAVHEFCSIYGALERREALPARGGLNYSDYAVWQRSTIAGQRYERHLDYWRGVLQGYDPEGISWTGKSEASTEDCSAAAITFVVQRDLVDALPTYAAGVRTTPFVVLLSMFMLATSRFASTHDVLIASATANRHQAALEDVIGFFANGRVTRALIDPRGSLRDLVNAVDSNWKAAEQHRELHLEQIANDLRAEGMMNFKFSLQNTGASQRPGGGASPARLLRLPDSHTSRRDLAVALRRSGPGTLSATAVFRTSVLRELEVRHLLDDFLLLVRAALANDGLAIAQLPARRH